MKPYRCKCGQLLFYGDFAGAVETKCRRCKQVTYIERILIKERENEKISKDKDS